MTEKSLLQGDEKFPLLMVSAGGGDGGGRAAPKSLSSVHTLWNNTNYAPRRCWIHRWPAQVDTIEKYDFRHLTTKTCPLLDKSSVSLPGCRRFLRTSLGHRSTKCGKNITLTTASVGCMEYLPSCWMTLVLVGIIFTVFYAIGMLALGRDSLVLVKCKENKTDNNVFMHHLVPRSSNTLMLSNFASLISDMARSYPLLRFNVLFLIDDSPSGNYGCGLRYPNRFMFPRMPRINPFSLSQWQSLEISEFENRHPNVKIDVLYISRFMSMTPLKHKWNIIPKSMWTFYARIFSVWQNSGISVELSQRRKYFHDYKLEALLKERNDNVETQVTEAPNSYERAVLQRHDNTQEKDGEYLTEVFDMIQQFQQLLISSTSSLFSKPNATNDKNMTAAASDKKLSENVNHQSTRVSRRMKRHAPADPALLVDDRYPIDDNTVILDLIPDATDNKKDLKHTAKDIDDKVDLILAVTGDKIGLMHAATDDKKMDPTPAVTDKKMDLKTLVTDDMTIDLMAALAHGKKIDIIPAVAEDKMDIQIVTYERKLDLIPAFTEDNKTSIPTVINDKNKTTVTGEKVELTPAVTDEYKNTDRLNSTVTINKTYLPVHVSNDSTPNPAINKSDVQENYVIMYDISLLVGPPPINPLNKKYGPRQNGIVNIDSNGYYVSSSSRYHPFLYQILETGCRKIIPRIAIFDAFMTQCNHAYRDDLYCSYIHII